MSTKHTPEPWSVRGNSTIIDGADGWAVAVAQGAGHSRHQQARDAKHIVACVNACAGVNPDAIQGMREALQTVLENLKNLEGPCREQLGEIVYKTLIAAALKGEG